MAHDHADIHGISDVITCSFLDLTGAPTKTAGASYAFVVHSQELSNPAFQ